MTPALQQLIVQARADADAAMVAMKSAGWHALGWGLPTLSVAVVGSMMFTGFAALLCLVGVLVVVCWMHDTTNAAQRHAADALARWGGILDAARAGEP